MEKTVFSFFLLVLVLSFAASYSQSVYSRQNLEQASREELNIYQAKAQKLKKAGFILSIAGTISFVASTAFIINTTAGYDDPEFIITACLAHIGFLTAIVGVPILITGALRVKRITRIKNKNPISFEIAPCMFQNYLSKNSQHGATLKIRF